MFTTTEIHIPPLAQISNFMSLLSTLYGLLNVAVTATSDFSVVLSFIHRTHLPTTSSLFINSAKNMQRLRTCVTSIPVSLGSPVDAFILSRLTQISGRRG